MIEGPLVQQCSQAQIPFPGHPRSNRLFPDLPLRQNTGLYHLLLQKLTDQATSQFSASISALCSSFICDNLSAIALAFNPVQHQKTNHIKIEVYFVREKGSQEVAFCAVCLLKNNLQIFTKELSAPLFHTHCNNLMLESSRHEFERR